MKVLLDTHAFIWWDSDPTKLSPQAEQRVRIVRTWSSLVWQASGKCKSSSKLGKLICRGAR